jgi:hypothetical protein
MPKISDKPQPLSFVTYLRKNLPYLPQGIVVQTAVTVNLHKNTAEAAGWDSSTKKKQNQHIQSNAQLGEI